MKIDRTKRAASAPRMPRWQLGLARHFIALLIISVGLAGLARAAQAWPEPWAFWGANDSASKTAIDHKAWNDFLTHYVVSTPDGINRVVYSHVTKADKASLDRYLAMLQALPIRKYRRAEQLPYWINLYNAATVRLILENYPLRTIRDLSSGFLSVGPWGRKILTIEGQAVSLDDIEQRILRPLWRDPRIHYALNCASLSCPNLQPVAFTPSNIDGLLERGARDYVNHPRGVLISYDHLIVSSIYRWYKDDFGGTDAAVIAHLARYAAAPLAAQLVKVKSIYDDHYDWSLNDAAPRLATKP